MWNNKIIHINFWRERHVKQQKSHLWTFEGNHMWNNKITPIQSQKGLPLETEHTEARISEMVWLSLHMQQFKEGNTCCFTHRFEGNNMWNNKITSINFWREPHMKQQNHTYESQKGFLLETKNTQNHENRRLGLIESLQMQQFKERNACCFTHHFEGNDMWNNKITPITFWRECRKTTKSDLFPFEGNDMWNIKLWRERHVKQQNYTYQLCKVMTC